jgi:hypothetical protein
VASLILPRTPATAAPETTTANAELKQVPHGA